ncbi:marine proteobacterial sortase target protein [Enterovibrio norvegicus]|uniref:Marine proteobacterial sortase target protein n=1 Tax=Enterovibrio norvegicus TaxID=188144 RepID=A0A2N7L4B7_9GAMM|nr:marine proteobacterial sortase target protein [Enterovibrio norvegicus]PMN88227.1 marine proteobacterial sortase target protein [Enterovibrio norvegicus]
MACLPNVKPSGLESNNDSKNAVDTKRQFKLWTMALMLFIATPFVTLANEQEGGLFLQMVNSHQNLWSEAPQLSTDADMEVNGLINRVTVTQTFTNPTDSWVNARYLLPLPQNAAVDRLTIRVGERIIVGEIQPKQKAREAFNKAAAEGKKTSLVEQHRSNLFSTQIANVAPEETIIVEIEYQETVKYEDGEFSLRFPTTFTQKYIPGLPVPSVGQLSPAEKAIKSDSANALVDAENVVGTNEEATSPENAATAISSSDSVSQETPVLAQMHNGWAVATPQVPDANEITPEYRDPLIDGDIQFTLSIDLNTGLELDAVESPSAAINVQQISLTRYAVTLSQMELANKDFELTWRPTAGFSPVAAMFVQDTAMETSANSSVELESETRYGLLMAMPPQTNERTSIPQNITFVLDVSGSMFGDAMEQAKEAVIYALNRLDANDYFNLIIFNDETAYLSDTPLIASLKNIGETISVVESLKADGGTEMAGAIELAYEYAPKENYANQIVFITDGAIGNEAELYALIQEGLGNRRLFTVGIGSAPNSAFMQRAAMSGKGTFTHIGQLNQVVSALQPLFDKLSSPVMQDIKVTWQDGTPVDAWPSPVPDLYKHQPLTLAFKIPSEAKTLTLSGKLNQQEWHYSIDLENVGAGQATGIDVLWARQQIESVTLDQTLSADQKEKRITQLGLDHHIVTKHTSLIAIDQTPTRPLDEKAASFNINPHKPQNSANGSNGVMLQSGLGSTMAMLLGGIIIMLSVFAWCWSGRMRQDREVWESLS